MVSSFLSSSALVGSTLRFRHRLIAARMQECSISDGAVFPLDVALIGNEFQLYQPVAVRWADNKGPVFDIAGP